MSQHAHRLAYPSGGGVARFAMREHGMREAASAGLRHDHPALTEARTIFTTTVVGSAEAPRLLIEGKNAAKIGDRIAKGPWRGLRVFTLTLEERATCPRTCGQWAACYGNAMPLARRHANDAGLMPRLASEAAALMARHGEIAVRLHVLGDFYSASYVRFWSWLLRCHPGMHLFGFTAHPASSDVGQEIAAMNAAHPDQCAIRFSVPLGAPPAPMQASVAWEGDDIPADAILCPAQSGKTQACATCGLCWHARADRHRIVFIGHGMVKRNHTAPRRPRGQPEGH
jgi:hypothetical protein